MPRITKKISVGITKNYISLNADISNITYISQNKTYKFTDPEELVRAEYYIDLIEKYGYRQQRIEFEVSVPRRTPKDRADIVVFADDLKKIPYIVIECKSLDISEADFLQAVEQVFGNANSLRAKFASLVSGSAQRHFNVSDYSPLERRQNIIADIPINYGRVIEYRYIKGDKHWDIVPINKEDLIHTLKKCNNVIWDGGKESPIDAFDKLIKLIFVKIRDEETLRKQGEPYSFQIKTNESAESVHTRINELYSQAQEIDTEVFEDTIDLPAAKLFTVVNYLQSIYFSKTDLDTKGVAFEIFMEDFFKGKQGQYFTPREIVHFMTELCEVQHTHKILDPACGSGGFLLQCLDTIRRQADEYFEEHSSEHREHWLGFARNNLFGIEVNKRIATIAKMSMILNDDGHTNILCHNSLSYFDSIQTQNSHFKQQNFHVVFTNPPFGASVTLSESNFLEEYTLAKNKNNEQMKSQKTEILFLERCYSFLKENGFLCIIVPDSILVNPSLNYVRAYIKQHFTIRAIVSLPDFTFSHYGATAKSSILLLKKETSTEDYTILFGDIQGIGYTASGKYDPAHNDLETYLKYWKHLKTEGTMPVNNTQGKIYTKKISALQARRFDVKGNSPLFEELKAHVHSNNHPKKSIHSLSAYTCSGQWGIDIYKENIENIDDYEICYVIRNTNFDNYFNLHNHNIAQRYIKKTYIEKLQLQQGDILIEKSGGSKTQAVGRIALFEEFESDKPVIFSNFIQLIRLTNEIEPEYFFTYVKTLWNLGYMEYIQSQTNGIRNLLMDEFKEILIPIIQDKAERRRIARSYFETMKHEEAKILESYRILEKSRKESIQLFNA